MDTIPSDRRLAVIPPQPRFINLRSPYGSRQHYEKQRLEIAFTMLVLYFHYIGAL